MIRCNSKRLTMARIALLTLITAVASAVAEITTGQIKGELLYITLDGSAQKWLIRDAFGKLIPFGNEFTLPETDVRGEPLSPGSILQLECSFNTITGECTSATNIIAISTNSVTPSELFGNGTVNGAIYQKLLVMIIDYPECGFPANLTEDDVYKIYLGPNQDGKGGYAQMFTECSYGKFNLNITAFKAVRVTHECSYSNLCQYWVIQQLANIATTQLIGKNVFTSSFTHYTYILPPGLRSICLSGNGRWEALATIPGRESWFQTSSYGVYRWATVMQEALHNYGLYHSWRDGMEYGDHSTAMGRGAACLNAAELSIVGWSTAAAELNGSTLPLGVVKSYLLPATYITNNRSYLSVTPTWVSPPTNKTLFISVRVAKNGDADLGPEFASKVNVHEAAVPTKDDSNSTQNPRDRRISFINATTAMSQMVLQYHKLVISAGSWTEADMMWVYVCRYEGRPSECITKGNPLTPLQPPSPPPTSSPSPSPSSPQSPPPREPPSPAPSPPPSPAPSPPRSPLPSPPRRISPLWPSPPSQTARSPPQSIDFTPEAISCGHTLSCVLSAEGTTKCFGNNTYGQLGLGDSVNRGNKPGTMGSYLPTVDLGLNLRPTAIVPGVYHTCALLQSGGTIKCWGENMNGQLGLGDTYRRGDGPGEMGSNLPAVNLGSGLTATAIAAGRRHTCALLQPGGVVKCWGDNIYGQLGLGDTDSRGDGPGEMGSNLPAVNLGTGLTATAITTGAMHTCALLQPGGVVKCWGSNNYGQLGLGDYNRRGGSKGQMGDNLPPVNLGPGYNATSLVAGYGFTCALLQPGGVVKCWGDNAYGQIGQGIRMTPLNAYLDPSKVTPIDLGRGYTATAIATGTGSASHVCALLQPGDVIKCWGDNSYGQLGLGDNNYRGDQPNEMGDRLPPVDLGPGLKATAIAAGYAHTCALLQPGNVIKCWGLNSSGQLGLQDNVSRGDNMNEMGVNLPPVQL